MNTMTELLHWVETTPVALFVAQTTFGFSAIDMVHIAAISVVFGTIALLDLRLMGVAFTEYSVTDLSRQILPWTWMAFAIAAVTGVLMFTGQAVKYSGNFAFLVKLVLMTVAGLNVLAFHIVTYRSVGKWDSGRATPWGAKFAGSLSLAIWVAVVAYGRFTAYYMYP